MNAAEKDAIEQLAGDYVLGTLSYARRREVEQRMSGDTHLRAAVEGWQTRLLPLTVLAPAVEPSAQLWARIEGSLQSRATHAPAVRRPRPAAATGWWRSVQLWRGLAGTGFAAAAVLAAVLVTRMGAVPPAAPAHYVVVLVAPGGNAPGWVVQASGTQPLSLIPVSQASVPADKTLQFWTKGETWAAPVSLGLVKPGETVKVPLDKLPPLQPNQLFELTLEPPGGSPTGRPTGPIQFIGRAVKVV